MRQVGVLAAAGQVALRRTLPRLADDHDNAKRLAVGVSTIPGLKVRGLPLYKKRDQGMGFAYMLF